MTTEEKRKIDILKRDRKSVSEIAKELKLSPNTIKSYLQRRKSENSCLMCGMHVEQKQGRKQKKFCSDKCRGLYWREQHKHSDGMTECVCASCGKKFYAYASKKRKYCSVVCYRRRNG